MPDSTESNSARLCAMSYKGSRKDSPSLDEQPRRYRNKGKWALSVERPSRRFARLCFTPSALWSRQGRGRHGSIRDLRDDQQAQQAGADREASTTASSAALDFSTDPPSTSPGSPGLVHRRRSLSVLVDGAGRAAGSAPPRPSSQHGRSLPNARSASRETSPIPFEVHVTRGT